jgi:H+/Cl- antiporter ClcA
MSDPEPIRTGSLPVAPSMEPALMSARVPEPYTLLDARVVRICLLAVVLAIAAAFIAVGLTALIGLVTNLAYYGRFSWTFSSPAGNHLGPIAMLVPVIGGLIVGVMARYGSSAIRGHGIPEAMEQILLNESRIPARMTFLKPVSAAIAIGTGGPFGAEGPIIATGGALGSLIGQFLRTTASERKVLLAAGAAAGMAATFGSPVSAVLLAVELLLFEMSPRSMLPVALAAATATAMRGVLVGSAAVFPMPPVPSTAGLALAGYAAIGLIVGVAAIGTTRAVYAIEDAFEKLPIHWMWWPALGAVAVGVVGWWVPDTLGVGYVNIEHIVSGGLAAKAVFVLCAAKFLSWSIALGSGTSGGTLAPLFTIGGGLGALLGMAATAALPSLGVDPRVAAVVGMASIFAGASRAFLASVVFAFETTREPAVLLPLLAGCAAACLVSFMGMRHSIMTEKIARRGVRVPNEYGVDFLEQVLVRESATRNVDSLQADDRIETVRSWLSAGGKHAVHQGFPVVDADGRLIGVVTRRDLLDGQEPGDRRVRDLVRRPPAVVFEDHSLREAADLMVREDVGRLPVVTREHPDRMVGIVTRSDLLAAHGKRLRATEHRAEPRRLVMPGLNSARRAASDREAGGPPPP